MRNGLAMCGVTAWMLGVVVSASAQEVDFDREAGFPVRIGERVILQEEALPEPVDTDNVRAVRDGDVLSLRGPRSRRELKRLDDRLEYTFRFELPASSDAWTYSLKIPLPAGTTVRVTHGFYRKTRHTPLIVGASDQELAFVRFIEVRGRTSFAIDTDPGGAWQDLANFDKQLRITRVVAEPNGLRLLFRRPWNHFGGGRMNVKLVCYGERVSFETLHPFHRSSYKTPLDALHWLDFTTHERAKQPMSMGAEPFDTERGYGWIDPPASLRVVYRGEQKALIDAGLVAASEPATFRMHCPPGDYLLTVTVGDLEGAVGPMSLAVNGEPWLDGLEVATGDFQSRTTAVTVNEARTIDLALDGEPWALNGVIVQPLRLAHEDYQTRRPWWHHELEPRDMD
ncbi:MAG: hypothetical protein ACODAQ_03785 [Phycisphaeraceae bacterium]